MFPDAKVNIVPFRGVGLEHSQIIQECFNRSIEVGGTAYHIGKMFGYNLHNPARSSASGRRSVKNQPGQVFFQFSGNLIREPVVQPRSQLRKLLTI